MMNVKCNKSEEEWLSAVHFSKLFHMKTRQQNKTRVQCKGYSCMCKITCGKKNEAMSVQVKRFPKT